MAKAEWCVVNPSSGSGNGSVTVEPASEHTGRRSRVTTITFKATGAADVPVSVTQKAAEEFVTLADLQVGKQGGAVTMYGISNASKLSFTIGSGRLDLKTPTSYLAGGITAQNATSILGDPGATEEYDFSVPFNIPANPTTNPLSQTVSVTTEGGKTASATVTQEAGSPTLSAAPTEITFEAGGQSTPETVTVTSNLSWSVA